ncbi:flavin reductase [Rhodococcus rhodochrous]|uniref:flavin reductase family protein n=1 Tax=Rhodococcus rhodochrous TaxID=1829 RepID=UPI00132EDC28|nr:flavin reductase family protein [Rhodococcus rhodochrous]QHG80652.1 flavin reductase [Rhodococcus rhodochrous]
MADTPLEGSADGFADIASQLDYPMFIVTAFDGEERSGCLIGFATQSAIDPARFLVALSNKNRTYRVASKAKHLAVHVLTPADRELAALFGEHTGDDIDKFERCSWREGPHGLPVLDGPRAWFVGRILETFTTGDHRGFLLEPERGELRGDLDRLMTFKSVGDLDAGHGA